MREKQSLPVNTLTVVFWIIFRVFRELLDLNLDSPAPFGALGDFQSAYAAQSLSVMEGCKDEDRAALLQGHVWQWTSWWPGPGKRPAG